jgi:hypothetical protein
MYFRHSDKLADQLVKAPIREMTKAALIAEAKNFDRIANETLVRSNALADVIVIGFCCLIAWGALWIGVSFLIRL